MIRRLALTSVALGALAVPVATSLGGTDGSRQAARYSLSQHQPGKSTGERFVVDYVNPGDPTAKPPAVRRVVTMLPLRSRYDTSVPGLCAATDAELMAEGAAACPRDSRIGGGVVTVDTGIPGPGRVIEADVEFFNNTDEFIYLNTVRDSGARTVIRAELRGRKRITEVDPPLPGTPPDGGAIDTVQVAIAAVSRIRDGERRNYIKTPPHCPARGFWITATRFVYADGVSQTVKNRVRCERP
jgi:hypothetical protein